MKYSKHTDPALISLLRDGDHAAYTEIYNRYYYLMFVFAYKKLRDEELAKDFVQELFYTLWHKRDKILETGNLCSYLYISIRSRMLDYFNHQKTKSNYINSLKDYISEGNVGNSDYLVRQRQLEHYIEKEIQALPTKMRRVFELSRQGNFTNREIAKQLNTTESNISHHINNAVKILRTKLSIFWILGLSWFLLI